MRVLIFNGYDVETVEKEMQDVLSNLLAEDPKPQIQHVTQSECCLGDSRSLTITIILA